MEQAALGGLEGVDWGGCCEVRMVVVVVVVEGSLDWDWRSAAVVVVVAAMTERSRTTL